MISALNLLDQYLFAGIPSNAAWDFIKAAWAKTTARNWDELYLEAFDQAFEEQKPILAKYGDAEIALDRAALHEVLHQDVAAAGKTLSELTDAQFVNALADALAAHQVLTIGGNSLSDDDYRQMAANLVRHATVLFKHTVETNQAAFQQALIDQSMHNAALLAETKRYLEQHFDLALQALSLVPDIKADTEAIRRKLETDVIGRAAGPSRSERLSEMAQLSRARCIDRWQAAGLPRDVAIALADDPEVGAPKPAYRPSPQHPLLVLIAELGAGKSLLAERLFQYAISLADSSPNAPVPVFLKARDCVGRLRQAVFEQTEGVGDVRRQGATVVVDGADEAVGGADELLSDCRILADSWPHTTVVLTGRPSPAFSSDVCRERMDIELLSDEESTALIQRLSGDQRFHPFEWPAPVRDAIRRPLYAILLSGYLQNPREAKPQSTGELLNYLVERSLGRANANRMSSDLLLQRLAVLSVDRAGASVPAYEIGSRDQVQALLDSRLVVERGSAIAFPLALLTEWFAAHSLANGTLDPVDLVSDRVRLERWRYPIVMFVSLFGTTEVSGILEKLAEKHPAFTSTILSEALPKWEDDRQAAPLDAEGWGSRLRTAMQAWTKGIGPIAKLIAPVSQTGELRPLGIRGDSSHLVLGWYQGSQNLPGITSIPLQDQRSRPLDWPLVTSTQPGQHPAWAWRWTRDILRDKLTQLLRGEALPLTDGPLTMERVWQISQAMIGHGSHWEHPIPLLEIESSLQRTGENTTVVLRGHVTLRPHEVDWYRQQIASLRSTGLTTIDPPYPGPDLYVSGVGWIWDEYSDEQLLRRTEKVLAAATEGYAQLVTTWFPAFEPELATAALSPARLVGMLVPPSREKTRHPEGLVLHWYWLPLERGEQSEVCIRLGTEPFDSDKHFEMLKDHIRRFRHQAASWLPVSIHHGAADKILTPNPATQFAYEWLLDDFRRISWVGR